MFGSRKVQRQGLEVVFTAQGMLEANIIKGRLEASGIPALLDHESQVWGMVIDQLGEVRIFVPAEHAQAARDLLALDADDVAADDESAI